VKGIRQDAASIGPATAALCDLILDERTHPDGEACDAPCAFVSQKRLFQQYRRKADAHADAQVVYSVGISKPELPAWRRRNVSLR